MVLEALTLDRLKLEALTFQGLSLKLGIRSFTLEALRPEGLKLKAFEFEAVTLEARVSLRRR